MSIIPLLKACKLIPRPATTLKTLNKRTVLVVSKCGSVNVVNKEMNKKGANLAPKVHPCGIDSSTATPIIQVEVSMKAITPG
jgi:hypothetical protein